MAEHCIVLTETVDATLGHVPFVAEHLPEGFLRVIDPYQAVVQGHSLSFSYSDGVASVIYEGEPLDHIRAVWDRRPTPLSDIDLEQVDEAFRRYSRESIGLLGAQLLTAFPDALWISDRLAIRRAEIKSHQLKLASALGFSVPETLITSDPDQARAFVRSRNSTIVKGLTPFGSTSDPDNCFIFLATKITAETDLDYEKLRYGPAIFQQAIDVDEDLRITVVGSEVYAAAIEADTEKDNPYGIRDWRLSNFEGNQLIEARILPPDIERKCALLVKTLGLQFGAIDMIRDKQGQYWFIEINPNGQWAFVEEKTKQPIGRALARLILSAA